MSKAWLNRALKFSKATAAVKTEDHPHEPSAFAGLYSFQAHLFLLDFFRWFCPSLPLFR
jgi:hypothetical protein